MRSRLPLFALVLALGALVLPHVTHAAIPFFGPIIPESIGSAADTQTCALGWGAVIIIINNVIELLITLAIMIVAPIMIAYAGFLMVTEPVSAGGHSKARSIMWNTVLGIVIALAGWLIVDAVMAVLYHPDPSASWTDTWSSLITTGGFDPCIKQAGSMGGFNQATPTIIPPGGVNYLAPVPAICSPSALISYGINQSISNKMSCIAMKESSCNLTASNPNSSAFGLFQIVNGYDDTGHNLNFSVCTEAAQKAGFQVSGDLNCHNSVLRGGVPNPSQITLYNACRAASANPKCNSQAAQWLYDHNGGYNNWAQTAPKCDNVSTTPSPVPSGPEVPIRKELTYNDPAFPGYQTSIKAGETIYFKVVVPPGQTQIRLSAPSLSQNTDLNVFMVKGTQTLTASAAAAYYADFMSLYGKFGYGYAFSVPYNGSNPVSSLSVQQGWPRAWARMGMDTVGESILLNQGAESQNNRGGRGYAESLPGTYYIVVKNEGYVGNSSGFGTDTNTFRLGVGGS